MTTRSLFRHNGSPAAEDHLRSLTDGFASGRVLATYRAWPSPGLLAFFLVPALVVSVLAALIAPNPIIAVVPVALGLGVAAVFMLGGFLDQHRICEHALVLGYRADLVLPFETIDPGRVYDARGLFLARHVVLPSRAVHGSSGPLLLINGLRGRRFAAVHGEQPSLFGYYTVGTRRQRAFLEELERAMVADGYTEAKGLANSTLELRRVRPTYTRGGPPLVIDRGRHDPPLGVDAPAP